MTYCPLAQLETEQAEDNSYLYTIIVTQLDHGRCEIMSKFNEHHVSLVTVVQQIDQSHYMGCLATNILTSFAELVREMIGYVLKMNRYASKWPLSRTSMAAMSCNFSVLDW